MFTELPLIETSTPAERLAALNDAKKLMSGSEPGGFASLFTASASTPGHGNEAIDGFIRLAEYITTGHDYRDTHPEGKRRPIIHNHHDVHVHPVALEVDDEDIPQEIKDFLAGFDIKPEAAEDEESAKQDSGPEEDPNK